jgi:hypothetical protein
VDKTSEAEELVVRTPEARREAVAKVALVLGAVLDRIQAEGPAVVVPTRF